MALNWFKKLKSGLSKSASKVEGAIASITGKKTVDQETLDNIEDQLILADLGIEVAARIAKKIKDQKFEIKDKKEINQLDISITLASEIEQILTPCEKNLYEDISSSPHVLFLAGVNGSGKTTTAGKIAEQFRLQNKSVILAASDTFRAAAVEQLKTWGNRVGAEVVFGTDGGDSAAVAYKAFQLAKDKGVDVVIIDTAGRLQNKKDLMEELTKTCRVLSKLDPNAPHQKVVVLDGTVGQNAHSQLKSFDEAIGLTGMIITKLDGSAKGGVVVSLAEKFKIPIHAVGVGEGLDDLQSFEAVSFSKALVGLDD
ncbi:signal recognition particle-docking protein FtsY [Alphaproteobacteria bacterium]|jgi:fused signal recognition particle receptor|nr:signal recognition particle-docking protein FtsY [Alphaproteobacteria bacterium]MDB2479072.1 signal recognition particle-docking protein FtsY [Alphaproteobacteria bacterium]MDB3916125.1 signal recognition particle-docking protein FtsY [Alphaproteobacteria bacterium]